jgi:membrane protein implicated in regulation of membrane protease activity
MFRLFILIVLLLCSNVVMAYVGPGAGISVLGSLLGILITIVVAISAIIMWPLRKMLKKRKATAATNFNSDTEEPDKPSDS